MKYIAQEVINKYSNYIIDFKKITIDKSMTLTELNIQYQWSNGSKMKYAMAKYGLIVLGKHTNDTIINYDNVQPNAIKKIIRMVRKMNANVKYFNRVKTEVNKKIKSNIKINLPDETQKKIKLFISYIITYSHENINDIINEYNLPPELNQALRDCQIIKGSDRSFVCLVGRSTNNKATYVEQRLNYLININPIRSEMKPKQNKGNPNGNILSCRKARTKQNKEKISAYLHIMSKGIGTPINNTKNLPFMTINGEKRGSIKVTISKIIREMGLYKYKTKRSEYIPLFSSTDITPNLIETIYNYLEDSSNIIKLNFNKQEKQNIVATLPNNINAELTKATNIVKTLENKLTEARAIQSKIKDLEKQLQELV